MREITPRTPHREAQENVEEPAANARAEELETSNPNEERFASIQSCLRHGAQAENEEAYEGEYAEDGEENFLEPEAFGDDVAGDAQDTYVSLEGTPEYHEPEVETVSS